MLMLLVLKPHVELQGSVVWVGKLFLLRAREQIFLALRTTRSLLQLFDSVAAFYVATVWKQIHTLHKTWAKLDLACSHILLTLV